ncbi:hypothetical protein NPIL_432231 [Nephila pilipes]|uniref:Uncharacterized protein n=1 Tax=Nephila pilipes TaxID=299642 RepID=A0A8X6QM97_NEPPI|nr:hypothetical protein NPIL_432231 [Nephila pilipes]
MDTANNTEVCELTDIDMRDLNLEEALNRVEFLTDSKSCETYCDYREQLIYNYSRQNSETMHFVSTSSDEESEIDTVANNPTPVITPANLDKNPTGDNESDGNDGFTVVNRKKKSPSNCYR